LQEILVSLYLHSLYYQAETTSIFECAQSGQTELEITVGNE